MSGKLSKEIFICTDCGHVGHGVIHLRGSAAMERIMWYILFLPGPFYSLWRRSDKKVRCAGCKKMNLVAMDSKAGMILFENKVRAGQK